MILIDFDKLYQIIRNPATACQVPIVRMNTQDIF